MSTRARSVALAFTAIAAIAASCAPPPHAAADLVLSNAQIWTGNPLHASATALAVVGDRILDIGGAELVARWCGSNTIVVDARGRRVVPGFNDAHVRFADGAAELDAVDLGDADTPAEFVRRIGQRVKARPGEWVLGGHWDERHWPSSTLPTRQMIDDVTNGTPVFVTRFDGHMGLANSAALGRAGVTEHTVDPPGGALVRDPVSRFPTGVLKDGAMTMVSAVIPKMTPLQEVRTMKRALEYAASLGVTSVQDMSPAPEALSAFADLADRGELTTRVYAAPLDTGWYDQAKLGVHRAFGSSWLRIGAVIGGADDASVSSEQDAEQLRTRLTAADYAGLQLGLQAGTSRGLTRALDLFGYITQTNGGRDRRLRLEQSGPLDSNAIERLAAAAVVVSRRMSASQSGNVLRLLFDRQVTIALGSGWPTAPLNPMPGVGAAIAQGLSVAQAVAAYTQGSAFAEFQDREKGTLARGKLADFVILSDDVFTIPTERVKDVRVLTTVVGGRVVHQRNP